MGTPRTHSVAALLRENTQLTIRNQLLVGLLKNAEEMLHQVSEGEMPPDPAVEAWLDAYDEHFGGQK